jgi:hypothetical protein
MDDHEDLAERMEREAEDMKRRGDAVAEDIADAREAHSEREPMPPPEPDETD